MDNNGMLDSAVERELALNGAYASVTRGGSMRPLFRTHRDVVVIVRADKELKPYDVALYKGFEGQYILHRVLTVRQDCYIIRGDNTFIKERVPKSAVIGVLSEFNRKGRAHTVNDFSYKLYSRLWRYIYPFRFIFFLFYKLGAKIKRSIIR